MAASSIVIPTKYRSFTTSAADLAPVITPTFTIAPAAARSLVFSSVPVSVAAATPFAATLQLRDRFGNTVSSDNTSSLTLSTAGKASSILGGPPLTQTAAAGVFQFDDLTLSTAGKHRLLAKLAAGKSARTAIAVT